MSVRLIQLLSIVLIVGTAGSVSIAQSVITVAREDVTVLMADVAARSESCVDHVLDPAKPITRTWVGEWRDPEQAFEWSIDTEHPGLYEVVMTSEGASAVRITCGRQTLDAHIGRREWNRNILGEMDLARGRATIRLELREPLAQEGTLRSLELIPVDARDDIERRIQDLRSDTEWFREAKYGVMFQWGAWGYPRHGDRKPWPQMIDDFDVDAFARMVDEEMGAGYVIWSITWRDARFPAPLASVERILPGYTTKRDLIGDLAVALKKRRIPLMLYYHPGHEDERWWRRNWVSTQDKTRLFDNWCAVIGEIGERYGTDLAGWFFDDGIVYAPAPFERLAKVAKAGNPGRLVAWNPWILPPVTRFQDVQFGEAFHGAPKLPVDDHGIYREGPMRGLQAHGMIRIDGPDWGIWRPDTEIHSLVTPDQAVQWVQAAAARGQPLTLNLLMYEDGSVSPASLDVLRAVRQELRRDSR